MAIDPARLREQRAVLRTRTPPKPTGPSCFTCGKRVGPENWYGLCGKCVHRVPQHKRQAFRTQHLQRKEATR